MKIKGIHKGSTTSQDGGKISSQRKKSPNFNKKQEAVGAKPSRRQARQIRWNSDGIKQFPPRYTRSTLVKTGGVCWYEQLNEQFTTTVPAPKDLVEELRSKADKLLQDDIQTYRQTHSYGDFVWIERVLKGGTLADKMAAYTTLLQDSAVHNLVSLDALLTLVSTKAKRECIMALDTLKDLFTLTLLPENRKLRTFEMHPLSQLQEVSSGNQSSMNRHLILWYFEDLLKKRYSTFLQAVEKVLHDTVLKTKSKAISGIGQMLSANPEQEQLLLSMLVNKLGDPETQVAGKVVHSIGRLLENHPNMKGVVAQEIERFLYRPHLSERAQYYSLCCLNQILLDKEDGDLALHLTKVYLGFFRACLKKRNKKLKGKDTYKPLEEVDVRLMGVTLTGLSRVTPFNKQNSGYLAEHTDSLFALLHKVPFNIRIQTLTLLFQVDESGSERFYSALYRSLLDPGLQGSSRQAIYLNLLYRCLKNDPAPLRVMAFTKRIFQVCHYLSPPLACGLLILVSQIFQNRPEVVMFKDTDKTSSRHSSLLLDDDGEEHYEDVHEEEEEGENDVTDKPSALSETSSSWIHLKNVANHREDSGVYNLHHRNPLYSLGGRSIPYWELPSLSKHYHPSVGLFAKNLALKRSLDYCGDPLQDFTLSHFLQRFVYRNPKKPSDLKTTTSGERKKHSVFGKRKLYIPLGLRQVAVQSSEYVQHQAQQVPVEERFLYDYMLLERKRRKMEKSQDDDDDDTQSVNSDDFQMMLNRTEPGSMRDLDFAEAVLGTKGSKKFRKIRDDEDEDITDDDDDDNLDGEDFDDDEVDFADDDEFQKAFEDYDEDLQDFAAEEFDEGVKTKSMSKMPTLKKKAKGTDLGDLFASAEQFSGMLEDDNELGKTKGISSITAGAVSVKDKAGPKQLQWEMKRQPQQWRKARPGKWKKTRESSKVRGRQKPRRK